MTIIDELAQAAHQFINRNGEQPRFLYLSQRKMNGAKAEIGAQCGRLVPEGITNFAFDGVMLLLAPFPMWPEIVASGDIIAVDLRR